MTTEIQVYDKAKWHFEGDSYPDGLPESNAYTHGGFLLAWFLNNGLLSPTFLKANEAQIQRFKDREVTAGAFYDSIGGVLASDMLTETGNAFAEDYVNEAFIEDYEMMFEDDFDSVYEVPDNENNLKRVMKMLQESYNEWKDDMDDD